MTLKETLINFFNEKNVYPPITRKKVEKAGFQLTPFLLECKERCLKADDVKTTKARKTLEVFLKACEDLV